MNEHTHTEKVDCPICWPERYPVQQAIDALLRILNVHENHLFPDDTETLNAALKRLNILKNEGFQ